jgi:hypothetical protein
MITQGQNYHHMRTNTDALAPAPASLALDISDSLALMCNASRLDDRCGLCAEESPGSMETRRRITSGGGNPRESATESKPPRDLPAARVKGCGKSAPRGWQQTRHGKPRREQNQIGAAQGSPQGDAGLVSRPPPGLVARGVSAMSVPDEWSSRGGKLTLSVQNPAYRPAGISFKPPEVPRAAFQAGDRNG